MENRSDFLVNDPTGRDPYAKARCYPWDDGNVSFRNGETGQGTFVLDYEKQIFQLYRQEEAKIIEYVRRTFDEELPDLSSCISDRLEVSIRISDEKIPSSYGSNDLNDLHKSVKDLKEELDTAIQVG